MQESSIKEAASIVMKQKCLEAAVSFLTSTLKIEAVVPPKLSLSTD
jgi:hypothetical protein